MKPITIFRGTAGLNNRIDPARIEIGRETGIQDLAAAVNIDIDDTGRISRRKGVTRKSSTAFHSLYSADGMMFGATGTSLVQIHKNYSTTILATITQGARVSMCKVNDEIFWCDGYENGKIKNGSNNNWTAADSYVGPTTDREYFDAPVGEKVAYHYGRVYVIQGEVAWYSEPFDYNRFDLTRNFFWEPSEIRMFRPVVDGIYVSNQNETAFYDGTVPSEMSRRVVANYPAIEWSDVQFVGQLSFDENNIPHIRDKSGDLVAMWMSKEGICFGGPGGRFYNITSQRLVLPTGLTGSAAIKNGKFIGLIDP